MANENKDLTSSEESKSSEVARTPMSSFEELESMLDQYMGKSGWFTPFHSFKPYWGELKPPFEGQTPKVDVIDRDKEVVVKAELPGVKKDDVEVSISERTLTIRATTKHEEEKEEGEYHRKEISKGSFTRTLSLPADVHAADAQATFKDGLLELTFPKLEETKRHKVKIS